MNPPDATMYLIVLPFAFLAALVDAIAGGGGLISLPAYMLAGLPPQLAAGTNKGSSTFGAVIATAKFARQGRIRYREAGLAIAGALPGGFLGAQLLLCLSPQAAKIVMAVLLPVAAVVLIARRPLRDAQTTAPRASGLRLAIACMLIGLAMGMYDGFFGPGTGTFLILLFSAFLGMDSVCASGTAKLVNLASSIVALVTFATSGQVIWALSLPAAAAAMLGGYVGSALAIRRGAQLIRPVTLGVLAMILVKLAYDLVVMTASAVV